MTGQLQTAADTSRSGGRGGGQEKGSRAEEADAAGERA